MCEPVAKDFYGLRDQRHGFLSAFRLRPMRRPAHNEYDACVKVKVIDLAPERLRLFSSRYMHIALSTPVTFSTAIDSIRRRSRTSAASRSRMARTCTRVRCLTPPGLVPLTQVRIGRLTNGEASR